MNFLEALNYPLETLEALRSEVNIRVPKVVDDLIINYVKEIQLLCCEICDETFYDIFGENWDESFYHYGNFEMLCFECCEKKRGMISVFLFFLILSSPQSPNSVNTTHFSPLEKPYK